MGLLLLRTMLGVSAVALVDARSPRLGPAFADAGCCLSWLGGAAADGPLAALAITAGVDVHACAALGLTGVALRYALLRDLGGGTGLAPRPWARLRFS